MWQHRVEGLKAKCNVALGKFLDAETNYLVAIRSSFSSKYDSLSLATNYLNLGLLKFYQRDYNRSLLYIDTAELIFKKSFQNDWKHLADIFLLKAIIKNSTGDPLIAIAYLKQIQNTASSQSTMGKVQLSKAYHNTAVSYHQLDKIDSAIIFLEKCRTLAEELNRPNIHQTYKFLGKLYAFNQEFKQANSYYIKALKSLEESKPKITIAFLETSIEYMEFLLSIDDIHTSKQIQDSLNQYINQELVPPTLISKYYSILGDHHLKAKEFLGALLYYQKADSLIQSIHDPGAIYARLRPVYLDLYTNMASAYSSPALRAEGTQEHDKYISGFIKYSDQVIQMIQYSENLLYDLNSLFNAAEHSQEHIDLILVNWLHLEDFVSKDLFNDVLFRLLNQRKARVSGAQFSRRNYLLSHLPDSLAVFEQNLKQQLTNAYKECFLPSSEGQIDKYNQLTYNELALKYDSLINHINQLMSGIINLKDSNDLNKGTIDVRIENSVIIDYSLLGDSLLFINYIGEENSHLIWKPVTNDFYGNIQVVKSITSKSSVSTFDKEDLNKFATSSYELYNLLVADYENLISGKSLIIIPEGVLEDLSFDILIADSVFEYMDFRSLPYLIQNNPISYNFSLSHVQREFEVNQYMQSYFAIIPDSLSDIDIPQLKEAITEVKNLNNSDNFWEMVLLGSDSLEIQRKMEESEILHFAVHGEPDTLNPMLSKLSLGNSQNSSLYTIDILNSNLNADLVILSACNSAIGQAYQGEGMYSIGKAFFVTGCQSALLTTDEVEDYVASRIVSSYLQYIFDGVPKDAALQKAKIEFLQNASPQLTHPFYWSSFVQYGDARSLYFEKDWKSSLIWGIIVGVFLLLVAGIMIKRRPIHNQ
jgi:CHAT domain-containing protein